MKDQIGSCHTFNCCYMHLNTSRVSKSTKHITK